MATIENVRQRKGAHIYKLADGNRVPGVTTILGVLDKPALVYWAWDLGKQGVDYKQYRDALADVGTITHLMVECDLRGISPDLSDFAAKDIDLARNAFRSWENWRRGKVVEPIAQELPLVSERHRYGGTIDIYARVDGVPTLLDVKSSKAIYAEHLTQVATYGELLTEHGYEVADAKILRIGRTDDESFEERTISPERRKLHWHLFLHCRDIYELQKQLKK